MCRDEAAPGLTLLRRHAASIGGFTLVELMIVVAVIAILAVIVLPSYQDSVRKARRTDARGALTSVAQLMERYNTETNTYVGASLTTWGRTVSENGHYTLALSNLTANGFTITATPAGAQYADDCGIYTLDQAGQRGSTVPAAKCW